MNKRFLVLLIASCIYLFGHTLSIACTGFMAVKDGRVLAAQNDDWKNLNIYAWFLPPEKGKYGCFFFGMLPGYPSGGINNQGLVLVGAGTPSVKVKPLPGKREPVPPPFRWREEKLPWQCSAL